MGVSFFDVDRVKRDLARTFIMRADSIGLVGIRRDEAALDFWTGAATALHAVGQREVAEKLAEYGVKEMRALGAAKLAALAA